MQRDGPCKVVVNANLDDTPFPYTLDYSSTRRPGGLSNS